MAETALEELPPSGSTLKIREGHLVVASPSSISEACFSVPALRALQSSRPAEELFIISPDNLKSLWTQIVSPHQVITYESGSSRKAAKALSESGIQFSSAILWDESVVAPAFAKLGIAQRLGYATKKVKKHLTDPVSVMTQAGPVRHRVNHYLDLVHELGMNPFKAEYFAPTSEHLQRNNRIAIVPGSDFGSAAEWPLDSFVTLAKHIAASHEIVIIPSPEHPKAAHALAEELGDPNLVVSLEGAEQLSFLSECRGLIGNDGSIPHLASLVGTPSVVIFGPNEPEWKRPLGKIHEIVHHREPCSGCLLSKCPLDHRCLQGISIQEVINAADRLFKED